ncbi:hypothetical protein MGYG_01031 [Nannizzia gypsea CBS 118893]|uniref:Globin-sensor domain-containing protein n=1 Tax=Arthroderma gypseum (strain ATCC MYA-4604 / CBS 118893) TaxID=535722 RepID=E5R3T5_ARTGP|nr:hypothetical protein MGYG_01031 [Nannizzia gypsea CBS 118893]EFQ97995.1 hypothetical protein MGYG_01031 [Nannizzia gypsea CBS 118893]
MTVAERQIQHVDEQELETSLASRVNYLKAFLKFTDEDGAALQSAKPLVAPALPAILDAIYTNLIGFDVTAKSFVPPQPEQDKSTVATTSVAELSLTHPNILHRKDFLKAYLVKLVSNSDWSDESKFWEYLDKVGVMHTGKPGFKHREKRPELRVEVMHMSLLLGFVEDIVLQATMGAEDLDIQTKTKVIRAFNKVLWIQNDLFQKHYVSKIE